MKPTYELLKKTREFIQKMPKLHKGWFKDKEGNCCVLGALQQVETDNPNLNHDKTGSQVRRLLRQCLPKAHRTGCISDLPVYNDRPETTKEDIVALFSKALRLAR